MLRGYWNTQQHNIRKQRTTDIEEIVSIGSEFSVKSVLVDHLIPSELGQANLETNNKFEEKSDGSIPNLSNAININPDPRIQSREKLTESFNEIRLLDWINELISDYRFKDKKEEFNKIRINTIKINGTTRGLKDIALYSTSANF